MSDKNTVQSFLANYVSIETEGNLILLKPNQLITLHFANEEGEFKSYVSSPPNLAKFLYDSVALSDSLVGSFEKQSE